MERFHQAQAAEDGYATALNEIRSGGKRSHWIWYVFPQIDGLGHSSTARFYALHDVEEASRYLRDTILRTRYEEIARAVADQLDAGKPAVRLMGGATDTFKLVSSITLFRTVAHRLARAEATTEFDSLVQVCDRILQWTSAQGFPPCSFTLKRCEALQRG